MYKRCTLLITLLVLVVLALPVLAQDSDVQEPIPISATFSYTWESPQSVASIMYTVEDGIEQEIWSGDLVGEATAIWRVIGETGESSFDGWLISEFDGTVLGEYEGTMTIMLYGHYPFSVESPLPGQWFGEWAIVAGTGDLENVHGHGLWWGPGNGANLDPENSTPDIAIEGTIVFMEPTTDG